MKLILILSLLLLSCQQKVDKGQIQNEIFQVEQEFEKMTVDKGIAEAFYYYADVDAVIKREKDTLTIGKFKNQIQPKLNLVGFFIQFGKNKKITIGNMFGINQKVLEQLPNTAISILFL